MKNTLETRLGMFFALALVATFIILEMIGSFDFFRQGVNVVAYFDTVKELRKGDPVRLAGYDVGRVVNISLATNQNKIEVQMKLSDVRGVKTDSTASIQFAGLLGQNYVAISFGSAAGQTITEGSSLTVSQQPDLGDIMNKIDSVASGVKNFTEAINPDDFKNLLGPFADFLKDNSPRVSVILSNAATISTQVAEGKGTVGQLIMDDTLYTAAVDAVTNLNATAGDLRGTIKEAREVVNQVTAGQGTIGRLVKDESLYIETTNAMTSLREILQKINLGQGSVGKLVNDDSFYRNIKVSLQKLDKAAESLEDQGPVSVLGIAVGSLF